MLKNEIVEIIQNAIDAGDVDVEFNYSNVNKYKNSLRKVHPTEVNDSYFIGIDRDVNDYRRFSYDNMGEVSFDY